MKNTDTIKARRLCKKVVTKFKWHIIKFMITKRYNPKYLIKLVESLYNSPYATYGEHYKQEVINIAGGLSDIQRFLYTCHEANKDLQVAYDAIQYDLDTLKLKNEKNKQEV